MRNTFWPNRTFERQSSQNSHTGLKFSPKRENSALFMEIVQNALFRSCAARFGQIKFVSVKLLKIVTLVPNSLQNGKTVRFSWKLYKTLSQVMRSTFWRNRICEGENCQNRHTGLKFSPKRANSALFIKNCRSCAARFGKIAFLSTKVVNSSHWPEILFKTAKQCAFHENCTKRSFQVMRSTFWPNCICERQSCQNRHTGLKFSPKKENSALFMKIVQNPFSRSCAAPFRPNRIFERQSCQNRHTGLKFSSKRENSALPMKIVQNALFRSSAARFGQIEFVSVKVVKIVTVASNSLQKEKTVRFSWKLYKTLFSGHAQHVLAKSNLWASKFWKSSNWPEIVLKTGKQCAFHDNCTKRSYQVMRRRFCPNRIFEGQSCQNRHTGLKFSSKRENSALSMKIVKNPFFASCAARFAQIVFFRVKLLKIVRLVSNSLQNGKKSALSMKIGQNALLRSCAGGFAQIVFLRVKLLKIVTLVSNSLQNGNTVRSLWKLYKTVFLGHAQHVLAKSHFWASKFWKSSNWPEIVLKTGKQCAFHDNCTKRSFQVMRRRFCPNRIFEGQTSQNR